MKLKPLENRLLIKVSEGPQKTPGGLYIPQQAQQKALEGIVMEVGSEVVRVKKGDKVIYDKFSGTAIEIEKQEFLIIKIDDVLARIEK